MANKKAKPGQKQGTARSRIEHGAIIDRVNVVTVFEPGDDVSGIDADALATLVAAGVVDDNAIDAAPLLEKAAGADGGVKNSQ